MAQEKDKTSPAPDRLAGHSQDGHLAGTGTLARGRNPFQSTQRIWTNLSRADASQGPCPGLAASLKPVRGPQASGVKAESL